MNDAFVESATEGEIAHWKLLAEVVAEVETHIMSKKAHERGHYYPKQIYYCASEEKATKFHSKYAIFDDSSLSAENRFVVETSRKADVIVRENQHNINDNIMVLSDDLYRLTMLVEALVKHSKMPLDSLFNDEAFIIPPQALQAVQSPQDPPQRDDDISTIT
ncbi:hypothetical protein BGZ65_000855 [Modicella reniformis]|uniref:Uncharacterized protein n=1 Tax=Modicella reniformis TaxID=1440133 RepID=A0A9P6IJ40_9FUNG|nr:hypothetical protein BGZ65_000855 [Modicella reniformis]